jgi:hydroxymethylpyrimidine/phosphomethylpyrimidine kinase
VPNQGRVLIIAGSDPGGGAGIQGDIKTVTALGGYAEAAITALTAQNTKGVFGIHDVPVHFIRQQITLVLEDLGADAIKTGMLHRADIIEMLAALFSSRRGGGWGGGRPGLGNINDSSQQKCPPPNLPPMGGGIPLVLDPVMFAKGGAALLNPDALDALRTKLLPLATIITPNIPEAEYLAGIPVKNTDDMKKAAEKILKLGCKAVLLKGGHLEGDTLTDILLHQGGMETFTNDRLHTRHTHGTGCTLASAIATGLAQGMSLVDSVKRARAFVRKAMELAPGFGHGHGPLGHHRTIMAFSD